RVTAPVPAMAPPDQVRAPLRDLAPEPESVPLLIVVAPEAVTAPLRTAVPPDTVRLRTDRAPVAASWRPEEGGAVVAALPPVWVWVPEVTTRLRLRVMTAAGKVGLPPSERVVPAVQAKLLAAR